MSMCNENLVFLIGRIAKDPICTQAGGSSRAFFPLATSENWGATETREATEHTEFHSVVAWRQPADFAKAYLRQGDLVRVIGKLRTRTFTKDDVDRTETEIEVSLLEPLESKETVQARRAKKNVGASGQQRSAADAGGA